MTDDRRAANTESPTIVDPQRTQLATPTGPATVVDALRARGVDARPVHVDAPRDPGEETIAHYRGPVPIARGGMGAIFKAHDPDANREVAIKVMLGAARDQPYHVQKFLVEGQVTAQLEHPNIVPVHQVGLTAEGDLFIAMKLVKGRSLTDVLEERREHPERWPLPALLALFGKVCDAMAFAHSKGVIHRDLKPDNIMVGEFGEVLVMDWGIARLIGVEDHTAEAVTLDISRVDDGEPLATLDGTVMGTPSYMPPEQAEGELDRIGPASDVYALGAILYQFLCGKLPYQGDTAWLILDQVLDGQLVPPSRRAPEANIPRELEAICLHAMARDPEARYPTATALKQEIEAYLEGRLVAVASYSSVQVAAKWLRRHKAVSAALAAVLLGAIALGAWQLIAHRRAVSRARTALAERKPDTLRSTARQLLERIPDIERRGRAASPGERRTIAAALRRLGQLVETRAELARLTGDDAQRDRLHDELLLLGDLAVRGENYALAEQTYDRAARLRPAGEAAARADAVDRARDALVRLHATRVDARLEEARRGDLADGRAYRGALAELATFHEPQTLARLVDRLRAITTRLRATTRATLTAAIEPTASERAAGAQPIAGGAEAIEALLRAQRARDADGEIPVQLDAQQAATIEALERRVERRLRVRASANRTRFAQILSGRQLADLTGHASPRELELLLEVLGILGAGNRAVAIAIGDYLHVESAERRATPGAFALARLAAGTPLAAELLHELAGHRPDARPRRFHAHTRVWSAALGTGVKSKAGATVESARQLLIANAVEDGLAVLNDILQADPDNGEARWLRGTAWLQLGQPARAEPDLRRAIALAPTNAEARYALGLVLKDTARLAEARSAFEAVLERNATHTPSLIELARLDRREGKLEHALARAREACRIRPDTSDTHLELAECLRAMKRFEQALIAFDAALGVANAEPKAWFGRGEVLTALGRYEDALDSYQRVHERHPKLVQPLLAMARLERLRVNLSAARTYLDRARKLEPDLVELHVEMAQLLLLQRDAAGALAALEGVEPTPHVVSLQVNILIVLGRLDDAEARLDRALKQHAEDGGLWTQLGRLRRKQGRTAEALGALDRAVALAPRSGAAYTARASLREALGQYDGALADYRELLRVAPGRWSDHQNYGQLLQRLGRSDAALEQTRAALKLAPDQPLAHVLHARVLRALGKQAESLAAADKAVALAPRLALAHLERARQLRRLARPDDALAALSTALAIDAELADAHLLRSVIRLARGDANGAAEDALRTTKLAPKSGAAWTALAKARRALGDAAAALADLQRACRVAPKHADAHHELGLTLAGAKRFAEAIAAYDRAIALAPRNAKYLSNRASARLNARDNEGAQRDARAASAAVPALWQARAIAAVALSRLGRNDEARVELKAGLKAVPGQPTLERLLKQLDRR